jgi:hypothetical protein
MDKAAFWRFLEEAYPSIVNDPITKETFARFFSMIWDAAYSQGATDMYDREEETLGAGDQIVSVILKR